MTRTQYLVRGLERRGWKEATSPSRKYRRFVLVASTDLWVGKAGALHAGKTSTKAVSMTDTPQYLKVLWEGAQADANT